MSTKKIGNLYKKTTFLRLFNTIILYLYQVFFSPLIYLYMIKHIVLFKFKDYSENIKNVEEIKRDLEALKTIIPQLISIKAGINVNPKEAYHLALEVEVKDMADLEIYATHPEHLKVGKRIREILDSRSCVDYQI